MAGKAGLVDILGQLAAGGLGPHGQLLLEEARRAAAAGLPLSVVVLAAALADVAVQEQAGFADNPDTAGEPDRLGTGFLSADEVRELDWLRRRRNQILHYDSTDTTRPFAFDTGQLEGDARRAAHAIAPLLDWLAEG
jgi:hypothetical protein